MKILILVENYPTLENRYPMAYVHSRLLDYIEFSNVEVKVISFSAKECYVYEGVQVITEKDYDSMWAERVISHAPNLKNHFRFISKHSIKNITFFIHGHEVLSIRKYYPKPYRWLKGERLKRFVFECYDFIKLPLMRKFFLSSSKFKFVFVSEWMKIETFKSLGINSALDSRVIYNPINSFYVNNKYSSTLPKEYDFITVRPFDGSKYCVDLVVKLAEENPDLKFLLVGKGEFFNYAVKPKNMKIIEKFMGPEELSKLLNISRFSLMPTRLDAQGVMVCEMAAFGIPLVTSDIAIAKEILEGYAGARFISNDIGCLASSFEAQVLNRSIDLRGVNESADNIASRFDPSSTTKQELDYIRI